MKKIFTTSIVFFICAALLAALLNSGCIKQCAPLSIDSVPATNDSIPNTDTTDIPPTDTTKIPPVDSTQPPLDSVQSTIFGDWEGTYYNKMHQDPQTCSITLNPDFTMTMSSAIPSGGRTRSEGTWKLIGTKFSADIIGIYQPPGDPNPDLGVEQLFFADYDGHNQTFTNGTWKDLNIQTGSGYFEMKKI